MRTLRHNLHDVLNSIGAEVQVDDLTILREGWRRFEKELAASIADLRHLGSDDAAQRNASPGYYVTLDRMEAAGDLHRLLRSAPERVNIAEHVSELCFTLARCCHRRAIPPIEMDLIDTPVDGRVARGINLMLVALIAGETAGGPIHTDGHAPVILGARVACADQLGMPDVMRLDPHLGYVAGDVKSGAADERGGPDGRRMKKDYGVQVSHYAKILWQRGWGPSNTAFIIDHAGNESAYQLAAPIDRTGLTLDGYHGSLLSQARLIRNGCIVTSPAAGAACMQCHWRTRCRRELEDRWDPTLLPQVGRSLRRALGPSLSSVPAIARLDIATHTAPDGSSTIKEIGIERLTRIRDRAILQDTPDARPFARRPLNLPVHDHEIHYDVESDPLQGGLVYLHGFHEVIRTPDGVRTAYTAMFADHPEQEGDVFQQALDFLAERPDGHVYVWSRFERTSMRALQARYPAVCGPNEVERLFHADRCTDLYTDVVLPFTEWPLQGYGLKKVARHVGFEWRDEDPSGANSIAWFSIWLETGDRGTRERIIRYNEDDVRATSAVLDALRLLEVRS